MNLKKLFIIVVCTSFSFCVLAEELKVDDNNTEFNIYTGMFDFSDDGKRATLLGMQHQNENEISIKEHMCDINTHSTLIRKKSALRATIQAMQFNKTHEPKVALV